MDDARAVRRRIEPDLPGHILHWRRASEDCLRAQIQDRARLQRELEHLADHDPLTGVANRRRLELDLSRELARARREGTPLCVVTIDLDGLKEHNDTYGHAVGDRLLKHVATTWSATLRATDQIARTGGDEFVVLLPDCPLEMAEGLIDRLRQAVAATCRCSAGAAIWDGRESAADLQARADLAMYEAKSRSRRGGNEGEVTPKASLDAERGELTVATTVRRNDARPLGLSPAHPL